MCTILVQPEATRTVVKGRAAAASADNVPSTRSARDADPTTTGTTDGCAGAQSRIRPARNTRT
ncbi:MAG TPA: hypothetical protein VNY97_01290, partial [Candidatus Angelobacter sp.]|nr:hypothetical protein [Candidatus Angelobacter sp.]